MPSPVGHTVVGLTLAAGRILPRCRWSELGARAREHAGLILFTVFLALLPDIDYLPGALRGDWNAYHHGYTHTILWSALVSAGIWSLWRAFRPVEPRMWLYIFIVLLSHPLADLFSADASAPQGMMLFWPLSDAYYISPKSLFLRLYKDEFSEVFQWKNLLAVVVELCWTLPLLFLVLAVKCSGRSAEAVMEVPTEAT